MKFAFAAIVLLYALKASALGDTPAYRTFNEWTVVCSNVRTCTAIGFAPQNESNAYVIVKRTGKADALPTVQFTVISEGAPRDRKLSVVLHGLKATGVPVGPFNAISDGVYARATMTGPIVKIFTDALVNATSLTISLVDKPSPSENGTVLLRGSAAALRWMDATQLRAGTVTALVARGPAPPSSIPAAPPLPSFAAVHMRATTPPHAPGPNPITNANLNCKLSKTLWLDLSNGHTARGECASVGAYNVAYRFFLNNDGTWKPVVFYASMQSPSGFPGELGFPHLSEDGLLLSSFVKFIGVGTCGESSDWVWTGSAFRLRRYAEMRECRGVEFEDWPALFESSVHAAKP
jgi:hypothetical protein